MKITNTTQYDTDDLRALFSQALTAWQKAEGKPVRATRDPKTLTDYPFMRFGSKVTSTGLHVTVVSARTGYVSGRATYRGQKILMRLPSPSSPTATKHRVEADRLEALAANIDAGLEPVPSWSKGSGGVRNLAGRLRERADRLSPKSTLGFSTAWVFIHELYHVAGYKHGQFTDELCQNIASPFAEGRVLTLKAVEEKVAASRPRPDIRATRLAKARRLLERAERERYNAEARIARWSKVVTRYLKLGVPS